MKTSLENRIALVIGGTGEIGTAICRQLHDSGARVVADSRDPADEWRIKLAESGVNVATFQADVRDFDGCARLIDTIEETLGAIDIIVNAADPREFELPFQNLDRAAWEQAVSSPLDSLFNVCRQVAERMSERGFGRIVNISSVTGRMGRAGRAHEGAAMAGVHGFTMALAQELARKGVTVNTVSPGHAEGQVNGTGTPEEVAYLVDFLCSEQAARINGTDIAVNGGQYMH